MHGAQVQGQGLGIIIWALAKICYDPAKIRSLLQAFAQEAIDRLTEGVPKNEPNLKLGPQSLSNMVYAYAVMSHHPGDDLLAAIAQGVQGQLRDFSPQVCPTMMQSLQSPFYQQQCPAVHCLPAQTSNHPACY